MRFKAVLVGALVRPFGKGDPIPWQCFTATQHEAEQIGKGVLEKLTVTEQATAYVRVVQVADILLAEIHTAKEKGPQGELTFAIARHNEASTGV